MTLGIILFVMIVLAIGFVFHPFLKSGGKKPEARILALLGVFIVSVSGGVYYLVGTPVLVSPQSFLEKAGVDGAPSLAQQDPVFPSLEDRLNQQRGFVVNNPEDVGGWSRLARTLTGFERYEEAIAAFKEAIALAPEAAALYSSLGETLAFRNQGLISAEAVEAFENAIRLDPNELFAKLYLGDHAFQTEQVDLAMVRWLALYQEAPVETPWLPLLDQRIRQAAANLGQEIPQILLEKQYQPSEPTSTEEIQAMTADEQQAMIENMVSTLAARLEDNPSDLAGWERLGRSYMMLGRHQEGLQAFGLVAGARPDDPRALENYIQALLTTLELTGQHLTDQVITALNRLVTLDSSNPTALFFLGQAAVERSDPASARLYWQRLLVLVDPESDGAQIVRDKLDSLNNQ